MAAGLRYRWLVCTLLFLAVALLYMDRQILALLKPELDAQMGWTDTQFGWINGAFMGAYGLSMLLSGRMVDRFGTRASYAVTMAAWSVSAGLTALAGTVRGFLLTRFAVGASEGGCFPASIKVAALWFPKRERALATSIFSAGAFAGAIIAPLAIPGIAGRWGWQGAYVAASLAGMVWLAAWLLLYNQPEKTSRLAPAELSYITQDREDETPSEGARVSWRRLLEYRQTWAFMLAKFLTDPIWWFLLFWLPDFFNKTRGLELKRSWLELVSIYSLITILSIAGGWLTGRLIARNWSVTRARKTGMLLFACCVLPIVAAPRVGNFPAVLLLGLAGGAHGAWSVTLYTTVSDIFPKRVVASVIGLGGLVGSCSSVLFQPFVGAVLDFFKSHGGATRGYNVIFLLCGGAYLVAFLAHHLLAPRFDPVEIIP